MRLNNNKIFLFAILGLTLVALLCVEAGNVREEDAHPVKKEGEKILKKRALDDGLGGEGKPKKKKKKKAPADTVTTTAAPNSSTTTSKAATSKPESSSTLKPSSTPKPTKGPKTTTSPEDPDDDKMQQLLKDQTEERAMIEKAISAFRNWINWMQSHNQKSMNKFRAQQMAIYFSKAFKKYIYKKPSRTRHLSSGRHDGFNGYV